MKAPKWSEIGGGATKVSKAVSSKWPVHAKMVGRIDYDALSQLPASAATKAIWESEKGWLIDPARYAAVPTTKRVRGAKRMQRDWFATLLKCGLIAPVPADEVLGAVDVFPTAEEAKQRNRLIKEPKLINELLGKETLRALRFPTKREICELTRAGEYFIALDMAAYYDQFALGEEVSRRFCFTNGERGANQVTYRALTLTMGQRQAVGVADAATNLLLDFPKRGRVARSIIDNVIFVGSKEQVVADATTFIERVRSVGATLNEIDVQQPVTRAQVAALAKTSGEWGGIALDMTSKTVKMSPKTLDKIRRSWDSRHSWTWRHFAAHIGLLFWSWGIIALPMADFFAVLRFVSEMGRRFTEDPTLWDRRADIWPSVWPQLERWTDLAVANAPRLVPQQSTAELLVMTDASEWGWGYVALDESTGQVHQHGERWSYDLRRNHGSKLRHSTFAEPQAVINTMCHLLRADSPRHVRFGSDNTVTVASYNRGFNTHSFDINECLRRCHDYFGDGWTFEFMHIPGEKNLADPFSRNRVAGEGDRAAISAELRRLVGNPQPASPPGVPTVPHLTGDAFSVDDGSACDDGIDD